MFINEAKKVFEMNAAEYKAAMTYGTEAYKALRELRADYPGFRAVEMKPKKSRSPLDKLDMKTVRAYVRAHGSDTQKEEFLNMSTSHYTESGVYIEAKSFFEVKKWFLVEFPKYKEAVDDHEKEMERIFTMIEEKIAEAEAKAIKEKRSMDKQEAERFMGKAS
jgi:hypothetical protein